MPSPFAGGELGGGAQQQAEVEAERPTPHVGDVHLQRLDEGAVGAGGDLPEAGDALRHRESLQVVGREVLCLVRDARARAN